MEDWQPLSKFVADSPFGVASYVFRKGLFDLLKEDLWGREKVKKEVQKLRDESEQDLNGLPPT